MNSQRENFSLQSSKGRASVGPSSVWGNVGAGSEEAGEKGEGGEENRLNERKRKRRCQSVPHRDKRMRRDEGKGERMISDQGRAGNLKGKETSRGGLVPFCELDRSCLSAPALGTRKMAGLRDVVSVPVQSGTSALKPPAQIDLGSQAEAQKEEKEQEPVSADHFEEFYEKSELIGEGGFGRVYEGYRKLDNLPVALKFVDRTKITRWVKKSDTEDALPLEIVLQELVCSNPPCPGVIRMLEYYKLPTCYLLVLERPVPCLDLFDYMDEEEVGYLDEPLARHFLWQIVEALQHCHARGVVHGDLKPENILLETADHRLKLLDFGSAAYLRDEIYTDLSGTREYFPPEKIRQRGYRAIPAAVWSVGILLFQIVCGHLPSHNNKKVLEATLYFPRRISQDCRHLIRGCLSACPEKRPTLDEILQHPWMQH